MKKLVFLLVFVAAQGLLAIDKGPENGLLGVKTIHELKRVISFNKNLKLLRSGCEYELKNQKTPRNCYKLNRFKKENGAIDQKTYAQRQIDLDDSCLKFSEKLTQKEDTRGLSGPCAVVIAKKNQEVDYINKEEKLE